MKVVTILVVLTLALSMVAPIAAASGDRGYTESVSPISSTASIADHDGPPPGMVGVPSSNVGPPAHAGPSAHANIPTDAAAWSLHADKHADTLELEIDATSSGEPVLRAIDDKNHEGRTIAVDATTLADAVGHRPAVAHGDHSSGEEWSAGIDYENGYAKIDVPKFSTNEITFDGEVNVRGNVSDGSTLTYDIDSADGVDEVNATLTGTVNSEWNNHSASASAGESDPINIGGNVDPGGPANGNPQLTATGVLSEHSKYYNETLFTSSGGSTSLTYTNVSGSMDQVIVDQMIASWGSGAYNVYYDLIVEVNGNEEHRSSHSMDGGYGDDADEYKVHDISGVNVSDGDDVTVTFQQTGSDDFSTEETVHGDYVNITMAGSDVSASVNSESFDFSGLDPGETASKEVTSLSTGEEQIDWSGTGSVDWSLEINERAETVDPSIEVNGESDGYTGRLSEGETKSLNISASTITEGTNTINVSTGTSNGVITTAELDYTHPAPTDQSVSYESQTWSERYNVSRTWDSATLDASVTIPFASSRVVAIRDVEMRTNGGSWSAVPSSSYTLDGTTLEVGLGDVNEGDEIGVRANGSKVTVENGAIDVVEPTIEGNTLDTQLEIAEKSDGFGIDVGGTSEGNWLHKTANESWTAAETYTTITASGSQTIRAPGASSGATMNRGERELESNDVLRRSLELRLRGRIPLSRHDLGRDVLPLFRDARGCAG